MRNYFEKSKKKLSELDYIGDIDRIMLDPGLDGKSRSYLLEKKFLFAAMKICGGSRSKTAEYIGCSIRQIGNMLERHGDLHNEFYKKVNHDKDPSDREYSNELDPLQIIRNNKIKDAKESQWYQNLTEPEKRETLKRIRGLYL